MMLCSTYYVFITLIMTYTLQQTFKTKTFYSFQRKLTYSVVLGA